MPAPPSTSSPPAVPGTPGESIAPTHDRLWIGTLLAHGPAPHEFHRNGHRSYYADLATESGTQRLWGIGLETAFRKSRSQPQPGDHVGIRENNLAPVSFVSRQRNAEGVVVATRQVDTPRPRWIVEKLQEFDMRAAAARALRDPTLSRREAVLNHRELKDAFILLDTGATVAEQRFQNPDSRRKFMALLRETMALTLERGEALPKLRDPPSPVRTRE